jgi:hypothetical protein
MRYPALAAILPLVAFLLVACGDEAPAADSLARPETSRDAIVISSLDIDAPLASKRFQVGAALPSPDGSHDVVLYDFASVPGLGGLPGEGGNVVMSGRSVSNVCTQGEPPCNGVFVRLRFIAPGDRIDVSWRGRGHRYQVVAVCGVPVARFSDSVYRRTAGEQLTLISDIAGGGGAGSVIVIVIVARPAPVTAGESCPAGTLPVVSP